MQKLAGYSQIQSTGARVASATITVYQTGTLTLATIYADNLATPLSNPFISDANGLWFFYSANGHYDVQISGGSPTISPAYTLSDFLLNDSTPTVTMKLGSGAGLYSTNSTSFVPVDATNLSYTATIPVGWKLVISSSGSAGNLVAPTGLQISLLDGSNILQRIQVQPVAAGSGQDDAFSLNWAVAGDGASHTITLQYAALVAANAAAIENNGNLVPTMVFFLTPSN